jgi:membrane-bound lytic murein transglycosylase B
MLKKSIESEHKFMTWQNQFLLRAADAGVSMQTLAKHIDHIKLDPRVVEKQENQTEFSLNITQYLDRALPEKRILRGRTQFRANRELLNKVTDQYNVEAHVILAIWGIETNYAATLGDWPVLSSLATLACFGYRNSIFEAELVAALKMLERGDVAPEKMLGSWAGAMGHGQFMPTSYLKFAVDSDGDGRSNIWHKDPEDGLSSIANYLAQHGWETGRPSALEIQLPKGFDYSLASRRNKCSVQEWAELGVVAFDGSPIPYYGSSAILLPSGADGPAFMTFGNFDVLLTYNRADAYAIAVGQLADRLQGGPKVQKRCPDDLTVLKRDEMRELQTHLAKLGYDTIGADGFAGPNTNAALRNFQRDNGLTPDGFASGAILEHLRNMPA